MANSSSEAIRDSLARARGGDQEALGRVLERYRNYLLLLARVQVGRRLQSKVDPADVVQDVYVDAVRSFVQFDGESLEAFVQWLRKILAGKIAHLVRRYFSVQARDVRLERSIEEELDSSSQGLERSLPAGNASPSEAALRHERLIALGDAMERLSTDHRQVILLRQLEQLSFAEVGARMERSDDAVQKLWVRALKALRKELGGEMSSES